MGDVQGCYPTYQRLLQKINFSHSRDHLYILGDMVNRGPDSLGILRHVRQHQSSIHCVLGNHDLHLLAVAHQAQLLSKKDTLKSVLEAPDCNDLLTWLAQQPLARRIVFKGGHHGPTEGLLVHAGVVPSWSVSATLAHAHEVSEVLSSDAAPTFLHHMYGDEPNRWRNRLAGTERLRMITNILTRIRFCSANDTLELETKDGPAHAPIGFQPWFDFAERKTSSALVAFGHWSTLGLLIQPGLLGLDTGCAWGGSLSAISVDSNGIPGTVVQEPYTLVTR